MFSNVDASEIQQFTAIALLNKFKIHLGSLVWSLRCTLSLFKSGMWHTVTFNTVKYALNAEYAYKTIGFFKEIWKCRCLTQKGPDSPQNHQTIPNPLANFASIKPRHTGKRLRPEKRQSKRFRRSRLALKFH